MFTSSRSGSVGIIAGDTPITEATLPELSAALNGCLAAGRPQIVLNLEAITLFDSKGLEWLLTSAQECVSRGGRLLLASPNPLCRDILVATRLAERLDLYDDTRSAVRAFLQ